MMYILIWYFQFIISTISRPLIANILYSTINRIPTIVIQLTTLREKQTRNLWLTKETINILITSRSLLLQICFSITMVEYVLLDSNTPFGNILYL